MPAPPMPGPPSAPRKNYIIAVTSKDPSDVAQNGAVIKIVDSNLGESRSGVTNLDGQFIEDLANLTSEFSNADPLIAQCSKRGFMQTKVTTINTSNPGEEITFDKTITYVMGIYQTTV